MSSSMSSSITTHRVLRRTFPENIVTRVKVDFENILVKNCREVLYFAYAEWAEFFTDNLNSDISSEILKYVYFRDLSVAHDICDSIIKLILQEEKQQDRKRTGIPPETISKNKRIYLWNSMIHKAFKNNVPILKCIIDMSFNICDSILIIPLVDYITKFGYEDYKTWIHYIAIESSNYFFNKFLWSIGSYIPIHWWKENIISLSLLIMDSMDDSSSDNDIDNMKLIELVYISTKFMDVNNIVDEKNNTLLHHAVLKNNIRLCQLLLKSCGGRMVQPWGVFASKKVLINYKNSMCQSSYDLSIEFPKIRQYLDLPICCICGNNYDDHLCAKCGYKPKQP